MWDKLWTLIYILYCNPNFNVAVLSWNDADKIERVFENMHIRLQLWHLYWSGLHLKVVISNFQVSYKFFCVCMNSIAFMSEKFFWLHQLLSPKICKLDIVNLSNFIVLFCNVYTILVGLFTHTAIKLKILLPGIRLHSYIR